MQVHGRDDTVRQIDVGEYHTGAVVIYVGPFRIVTYTADDCDMLIAAACLAKERHADVLHPDLAALRSKIEALAMPDDEREQLHVAMEGTS